MPIYEYRCECGATLEALDRVGVVRQHCGELCVAHGPPVEQGQGRIERVFSAPGIRGDGREARAPSFDPVARSRRPGCDCEDG